ncbi:MAG: hypothetical protein RSC76_07120 [Oscillospiraceae bacterium]
MIPAEFLSEVKGYLGITWEDADTDKKVQGYIARGAARLEQRAGGSLNFSEESLAKALLLDYCRYANAQALEVFEKNFEAELLEMNLREAVKALENQGPNGISGV